MEDVRSAHQAHGEKLGTKLAKVTTTTLKGGMTECDEISGIGVALRQHYAQVSGAVGGLRERIALMLRNSSEIPPTFGGIRHMTPSFKPDLRVCGDKCLVFLP